MIFNDSSQHIDQPGGLAIIEGPHGLPMLRKSVFSRFCSCGGNITIGLVTDHAYAAAEKKWDAAHSGEDHYRISRHEWLAEKLKRAA